ncbi:MAG: pyruvate ferredoxin oxidoreductase [Persephonella sp.]|nr:MAG: pyruvate ferredoxin oxidoreductase [Persephonella sp.]
MAQKKVIALTGNQAAAEAMRQINFDIAAVYPISPQTELMGFFAEYVANGEVDTEMIAVDGEHSAMAACIGAAAAGARVITASAGPGIAYMVENLYVASGMRLPIVLLDVNRALSAPLSIHCDHADSMLTRDTSWISLFSENAQEAYHNIIMATKISEKALFPIIVNYDGYIVSHSIEDVEILDDETVRNFVGPSDIHRIPYPLLDVKKPVTYGATAQPDYYTECKYQQHVDFLKVYDIVREVFNEFAEIADVKYDFIEEYKTEDAEYIGISMGSSFGTLKDVVDILRNQGKKVGAIKIRLFRPFPVKELAEALSNAKGVAVLDRADSFDGIGGPLFKDVSTAVMMSQNRPFIHNFIYGLGGREVKEEDFLKAFDRLERLEKGIETRDRFVEYLQVRE